MRNVAHKWRRLALGLALVFQVMGTPLVMAQPSRVTLSPGTVVALSGTPHLWIADEVGVLHWVGDTRALASRRVDWSTKQEITLADLKRLQRGTPWLSAGLLKIGSPIYLVKWESEAPRPQLLHIQSIDDVEIFGIDESNYGALVLDQAAWEQRYGFSVAQLERGVLIPVIELAPTVQAASVAAQGPIIRSVSVQLSGPGAVEIDYWTSGAPRLRVSDIARSERHALVMSRLKPSTRYEFEVRSRSESGSLSVPFRGTFSTEALPADLAALSFTTSGQPTSELTMLEVRSAVGGFSGPVAVNGLGEVVWFFRPSVEGAEAAGGGLARRRNGNFVLVDKEKGLIEVTPAGKIVAQLPQEWDGRRIHHDVISTPRDTLLFLRWERREVNSTSWVGDAIWEWDPDRNETRMLWSAFDFLSPDVERGSGTATRDWLHANSLSFGPRGNLLISFRFPSLVVSISPDLKSLEWKLGGPSSGFNILGDDVFWGQHTASEPRPGHVLLFDNGVYRVGEPRFARAIEFELNQETKSARKVWEFRPSPDNFASYVSSAYRLPNDNTLVAFGPNVGAGTPPSTGPTAVYEVTPEGGILWQMTVRGQHIHVYRATPLADIAGERVVEPR